MENKERVKIIKKLMNKLTLNHLEALHIRSQLEEILDNLEIEHIEFEHKYILTRYLVKYAHKNYSLKRNYNESLDFIENILMNLEKFI